MQRLFTLLFLLLASTTLNAQDAESIARDFLLANWKTESLVQSDVSEARISDSVPTKTGLHHVYFQQTHSGIPVHAGIYNVSVFEGKVIHSGSSFINDLAGRAPNGFASLSAEQALQISLNHVNGPTGNINLIHSSSLAGTFAAPDLSPNDVQTNLEYMEIDGEVRLGWGTTIWSFETDNSPFVFVDAFSGNVIFERNEMTSDNWAHAEGAQADFSSSFKQERKEYPQSDFKEAPFVSTDAMESSMADTYRVYNWPVESPNFSSPVAPADGRTLESSPADLVASPLGWHNDGSSTYTTTRGNNVNAQKSNVYADCGASLDCDFALDLTQGPTVGSNVDAAIVNLFYWNNLIHDILWNYGFDEVAGNFQETNAGGGLGSDGVTANAQISINCNATFGTPPDGSNPTMNMFICNNRTPNDDGDVDNGVIAHEYGHGISNRLVGGPNTTSCLNNSEQAGEGFSDIWGLWLTMEPGDLAADSRGIGTWLFGQAPNGPGIRSHPYTTNMAVNPQTYSDVGSVAVPHGVGHTFATVLWAVQWDIIDQIPLDTNIPSGNGGNNIFMELMVDALQMTACGGTQLDVRDAYMAAVDVWNAANGNAIDACSIWENAWAPRGYGADAQSNGTGLGGEVDGFSLPSACQLVLLPDLTVDESEVAPGEALTYTLNIQNNTGATQTGVMVNNPIPDNSSYVANSLTCLPAGIGSFNSGLDQIEINNPSMADGETINCSFDVMADAGSGTVIVFEDDMESGTSNWTPSTGSGANVWGTSTTAPNSGATHWFVEDIATSSDQYLDMASTVSVPSGGYLKFQHSYDTEADWDGGVLEIETAALPLLAFEEVPLSAMTQNGYNSSINANPASAISGRAAWSGDSGGYVETIVDLGAYSGNDVSFRWRFASDGLVAGNGWSLDDVEIATQDCIFNSFSTSSTEQPTPQTSSSVSTCITGTSLPVELSSFDGSFEDGMLAFSWMTTSESNNSGFELHLREGDKDWSNQGFIEGAGTTNTEQSYSFSIDNLRPGIYLARLKQIDFDGSFRFSEEIEVGIPLPYDFKLGEAYPNPFNPAASFDLIVGEAQNIEVKLFDMTGRHVKTLFEGHVQASTSKTIQIDGSGLPSGSYMYRVTGETFASPSKAVVLLK